MDADRFSRVFDVLELVAAHPEGLTLTEISRRLGLPTGSGHNLLQRMVGADVLTVPDGPRYRMGGRAVRLSIRVLDGLELRAVARRHLHELSRTTGEDTYLAAPLGERVVYVDRVPGTREQELLAATGATARAIERDLGRTPLDPRLSAGLDSNS